MARRARLDGPDTWHHVMNRGIAKRTLFETDADRRFFCSLRDIYLGHNPGKLIFCPEQPQKDIESLWILNIFYALEDKTSMFQDPDHENTWVFYIDTRFLRNKATCLFQ